MTSTNLQLVKNSWTECLICKKSLGAESRDLGFMFCHEHRKCSICSEDLNVREARWCLDKYLEDGSDSNPDYQHMDIQHPRCKSLSIAQEATFSIKQSEFDYLNLIRLCVIADTELSVVTNENNAFIHSTKLIQNMSFEQKLLHLKMLEACIAQVQIAIKQDPTYRKDALAEREKKHFDKARRESLTSTRPSTKTSEDSTEIELGKFMALHEITERKAALKLMDKVKKGMEMWMKAPFNFPEAKAREEVLKAMIQGGQLSK